MNDKSKVTVAFIDEPTIGIGPSGRSIGVPVGAYMLADLDGLEDGVVMLRNPQHLDELLAMMPEWAVSEQVEVLDGVDPIGWAHCRRHDPDLTASSQEQVGTPAPEIAVLRAKFVHADDDEREGIQIRLAQLGTVVYPPGTAEYDDYRRRLNKALDDWRVV